MTSDMAATLDRCPFFEAFQPKHIEKVMRLGTEVQFAKDEVIFRENDDSSLFYVILSGSVVLETDGGCPYRIETLHAGDELGWSAMLNRRKQFQARAVEPVRALAIEAAALHEACDSNPYFGRAFLERLLDVVAARLAHTRMQLVASFAEKKRP